MSKLVWDADSERLYETGVDHVVLYLMNANGTYEKGVAWNGVTGITESPEGADANDIYADNIKYLSLISKEDWKGTVKAYTFPNEFNLCMGNFGIGTTAGGALANLGLKGFVGQQTRRKFALSWRSLIGNDSVGDKFAYKIHIAWGLSAAPSDMDHNTENDSPEAQEFSWEVSSIPPSTNAKVPIDGTATEANKIEIKPCAHIWVPSKMIIPGAVSNPWTNAKLAALEDLLYGNATYDAKVPTLTDLINHYSDGAYTRS